MDRYSRFANAWKTIGVSSRVKWQQSSAVDRFNAHLLRTLAAKHKEETVELLREAGFGFGQEDGRIIAENLSISNKSVRSCLMPLEAISLLSGVDSEVSPSRNDASKQSLVTKGCIFEKMMASLPQDVRVVACESYSKGIVSAVNPKAELKVSRGRCSGAKHCDFVVTLH